MSQRTRSRLRKERSAAQLEQTYVEEANGWLKAMDAKGYDPLTMHLIAYNTLESIERSLIINGVPPHELPTYKRRLGGQNKADAGYFTYCRRCAMREKDEDGHPYCPATWLGPEKERFYFSEDDGCTRGFPGREYK